MFPTQLLWCIKSNIWNIYIKNDQNKLNLFQVQIYINCLTQPTHQVIPYTQNNSYYITNTKLIAGTSVLTNMLAIIIKLLLNKIRMSSLTSNPPNYQNNCLQTPNEPNIHSVKYIKHTVCFNYWSTTNWTQNILSKQSNTNFLL